MSTGRPRRMNRRGFSLVELMVVIVIISLLATLVATNAISYLGQARKSAAESDIAAICTALDTYSIQNGGRYPDTLEALIMPDENGETFLDDMLAVPIDPWGSPYVYEPPAGTQALRVLTLGQDGAPGGEGKGADIDNVTMRARARRM